MPIVITRFELFPADAPTAWCVGFVETTLGQTRYADTLVPLDATSGKTDDEISQAAWTVLADGFSTWRETLTRRSPLIGTEFNPVA